MRPNAPALSVPNTFDVLEQPVTLAAKEEAVATLVDTAQPAELRPAGDTPDTDELSVCKRHVRAPIVRSDNRVGHTAW